MQNYCHQMRFSTEKFPKIRFRPGFCAGPSWRSLEYFPVLLAGLTGLLLREGEVELMSKGIEGLVTIRGPHTNARRGLPSPPPLLPSFPPLPPIPFPSLRSRSAQIQLGNLGSAVSSPSGI